VKPTGGQWGVFFGISSFEMLAMFRRGLFYDSLGARYNGWGFESGTLFFVASAVMLFSVITMTLVPEGGIGKTKALSSAKATPDAITPKSDKIFVIFLVAMVLINFGRNAVVIRVSQYLTRPSRRA
jgi:hypothetical protein